jgi:pyruvate formate lyase activating enzyme
MTDFVASVSPDIPWHVTAFHADYKMGDTRDTTADMLVGAADIGRRAGLRYVYAGNLPGDVGDLEDTRCAVCDRVLVARYGYLIREYHVTADGTCPSCDAPVPGRWDAAFQPQRISRPFLPGLL